MGNHFKVGDTVKRVKGGNEGEVFVVGAVGYYLFGPDRYRLAVWPEGVRAVSYGFHYEENLVLVDAEPTLEEQQAAAKAELDHINALIVERDTPKVGQKFLKVDGKHEAVVQEVFEGVVFYRCQSANKAFTTWGACQRPLEDFLAHFKPQ